MVSRRGMTRKKKVPEPTMMQEPPLTVNCVCCHCDAVFRPLDVAGGYLDRRCPSCDAPLSEEDYDAAAQEVLDDIGSIAGQEAEVASQEEMERLDAPF